MESKEFRVLVLPLSEESLLFKRLDKYSLEELINDTRDIMEVNYAKSVEVLEKFILDCTGASLKGGVIESLLSKRASRTTFKYKDAVVSLSARSNLYICCHLTNADLPFLSDFQQFKSSLSLVNKCFVTLGKGLRYDDGEANTFYHIFIRDTMLLAPGNSKALKDIGAMYEGFGKIDINKYRGDMQRLWDENPVLFKEYAMQDSRIVLKHINTMEEFAFELNVISPPVTLTSLSKAYVNKAWRELGYKGYQLDSEFTFGSLSKMLTPKGINASGTTGLALNYYIASYRGGRNESFMFGIDRWKREDGRK